MLPADLASGGALTFITLGLDAGGEGAQLTAVREAVTQALADATGARLPEVERVTVYGTGSTDPMVPFAPAIVAFFLYFFVYLLTGVSFLRERTGGTLERLMATPVTRGEVVTGYLLGFGLFATDPGRGGPAAGRWAPWMFPGSARCPRSPSAWASPSRAARCWRSSWSCSSPWAP